MTCEIIDTSKVSLNGSSSAYGGGIQSVSFNIGALSAGHRATVSLVSAGSLSTPSVGDDFTLSILGMNLKMKVGGFSLANSATAIPTLTLNLYDQSNEYLDQDFIQLKEEFPEPPPTNVQVIGKKMGPLPDKELTQNSLSLSPNRDTVWGDIRNFFKSLEAGGGFFGPPETILNETEVDYYTRTTNGKTIWYVNSDPLRGKTLMSVLGHLLSGDKLPNGPFDFSGSYRDVIVQLCSTIGAFAYWDLEKNIVKITTEFNMGSGASKMSAIASSCKVISTITSSDFTVSRSQGAHGSISSDYPGESFSVFGPKLTKFLRGKLLSPDFHYKKCGSSNILPLKGDGLGKAVAASEDHEVFAMYALQSVLRKQAAEGQSPPVKMDLELKGKGNAKPKLPADLQNEFDVDDVNPKNYEKNKFLEEYYLNSSSGDKLCSGSETIPIAPSATTKTEKEFKIKGKVWNDKPEQPPRSILGKWVFGSNEFSNGVVVLHKDHSLSTIIDNDGNLSSSADILRKYLQAVSKFTGRFYVIPEQSGLRTVKGNRSFHDYGYYMITDHSSPSSNFNVPEGYSLSTVFPFEPVSKCAISELSDLAKVCAMMYKGDGCFDGFLDQIPVVEFIRAMDKNELKSLFQSPGGYMKSFAVSSSKWNEDDFKKPSIQMFLAVKKESAVAGFEGSKTLCFSEGMEITAVAKNPIKILSKLTCSLSFGKETVTGQISEKGYKLLGITKESIGQFITEQSIYDVNANSRLKIWYDVDQSQSSIKTNVGHFYMSSAKMPKKSDSVWACSIKNDISVNAADVGMSNELLQPYQASAADQSDSYSIANQSKMKEQLKEKIANNVWSDTEASNSQTISFIATGGVPSLPDIGEGLESLNVSQRDGLLEVSITVGDSNLRAAKMAMINMRANNSKLRHGYSTHIPDTFASINSQRLVALSKGIIR